MDNYGEGEVLTPEEIEQLAALGVSQDKLQALQGQIQQAEAMRDARGPDGIQAGRTYHAAHPLSHISNTVNNIRGHRRAQDLYGQQDQMIDQMGNTRQAMMSAIMRQGRGAPSGGGDPRAEFMRKYAPPGTVSA